MSDNEPFEKMAKTIDGPELMLKDAEILCASARFCHRGGDIWPQIPKSNDPKLKENALRNACDCPSGRLVVTDKQTNKIIEPSLEKSIGLIEDQGIGVDGPIWVRGESPFIPQKASSTRLGTELLCVVVENQLTNHFVIAAIILKETKR